MPFPYCSNSSVPRAPYQLLLVPSAPPLRPRFPSDSRVRLQRPQGHRRKLILESLGKRDSASSAEMGRDEELCSLFRMKSKHFRRWRELLCPSPAHPPHPSTQFTPSSLNSLAPEFQASKSAARAFPFAALMHHHHLLICTQKLLWQNDQALTLPATQTALARNRREKMLSSELPSLVKYLIINSEEKPTVSLRCGFHLEVNGICIPIQSFSLVFKANVRFVLIQPSCHVKYNTNHIDVAHPGAMSTRVTLYLSAAHTSTPLPRPPSLC